jgi:hypothetical protein
MAWEWLNPLTWLPSPPKPQGPANPWQSSTTPKSPFQQNDPFQNKGIIQPGLQQPSTPQNPNGFIGGAITFKDQAALTPTRTQKAILTDIPISDKVPLFVPTQKMREDFAGDTSVTGLSERYGGSSPVTAIKPLKPQEDRGVYGNINRAVGEVTGLKNFPTYEKAFGGTADQIAGVKHSTVQNGLSYEDKMKVMAGGAKGAEVDLYGADGNYVKTQRVTAPDNALRGAYQFTKKLWDLPRDDPVGAIAYYGTPFIAPVAGAVVGGSTKVPVIARAAIPAINLVSKPLPALALNVAGKATVGAVAADQGAKVAGYDADWGQLARGKSPFIRNPELDKTPVGARLATAVTTLVPVLAGENWLNKKTAPAAFSQNIRNTPENDMRTVYNNIDNAFTERGLNLNKIRDGKTEYHILVDGDTGAVLSIQKGGINEISDQLIQNAILRANARGYTNTWSIHTHPPGGASVPSGKINKDTSFIDNILKQTVGSASGDLTNDAVMLNKLGINAPTKWGILGPTTTDTGRSRNFLLYDAPKTIGDAAKRIQIHTKNRDNLEQYVENTKLIRLNILPENIGDSNTYMNRRKVVGEKGADFLSKVDDAMIPAKLPVYKAKYKFTDWLDTLYTDTRQLREFDKIRGVGAIRVSTGSPMDTEYTATRDFKNIINKYGSGFLWGKYTSINRSNKLVGMQTIYSQPKPRKATKGQKSVVAEMFGTRTKIPSKPNRKSKLKFIKTKKTTKPVSVVSVIEEMFGKRRS